MTASTITLSLIDKILNNPTLSFYIFWIVPVLMGAGLVYVFWRWLKRKGIVTLKKKIEVKPTCPICMKACDLEFLKMPKIAQMPKQYSTPLFRILMHWKIREAELLACPRCVEDAMASCRLMFSEIHTDMARHQSTILEKLVKFQNRMFTPIKDRDQEKNGK